MAKILNKKKMSLFKVNNKKIFKIIQIKISKIFFFFAMLLIKFQICISFKNFNIKNYKKKIIKIIYLYFIK